MTQSNVSPESVDQVILKLNQAIDEMTVDTIEEYLEKLPDLNEQKEDGKLFAKKIIKEYKKGNENMKKTYKNSGILVASIILTITIGVTGAYAAGLIKKFTFFNQNTTVTIRTNENLSQSEAKEMADQAAKDYNNPSSLQAPSLEVIEKTFTSLDEVKKSFNIDVVLPDYIPADFVMSNEIHTQTIPDNTCQIYTTFTSNTNQERLFGITVIKDESSLDTTRISVTDSVYKSKYTAPSGVHYTLFEEDGGIIAQTEIDDVQYGLVFMNVDKKEIYKVIDSTDLTTYIK